MRKGVHSPFPPLIIGRKGTTLGSLGVGKDFRVPIIPRLLKGRILPPIIEGLLCYTVPDWVDREGVWVLVQNFVQGTFVSSKSNVVFSGVCFLYERTRY